MSVAPEDLQFRIATTGDVAALIEIRAATARHLTELHGDGPWSSVSTERGVVSGFRDADIIVAEMDRAVIGTFRLARRKPWALDREYFTPVERALYLTDMAVHPDHQRGGVGRACLRQAERIALAMTVDAIWLDAYDAPAGAGDFYASCGYEERGRKTFRGTRLIFFERLLDSPYRIGTR